MTNITLVLALLDEEFTSQFSFDKKAVYLRMLHQAVLREYPGALLELLNRFCFRLVIVRQTHLSDPRWAEIFTGTDLFTLKLVQLS